MTVHEKSLREQEKFGSDSIVEYATCADVNWRDNYFVR